MLDQDSQIEISAASPWRSQVGIPSAEKCWHLLHRAADSGEHFANRYHVFDNIVASGGLLLGGITLNSASVQTSHELPCRYPQRTIASLRPQSKKVSSDHLPVLAHSPTKHEHRRTTSQPKVSTCRELTITEGANQPISLTS
jgi:hypothetical protein